MTGNTDVHASVGHRYLKKGRGVDHHLPHAVRHLLRIVDQAVDCGLWNVVPLLFNGCTKLLDIGRNC